MVVGGRGGIGCAQERAEPWLQACEVTFQEENWNAVDKGGAGLFGDRAI